MNPHSKKKIALRILVPGLSVLAMAALVGCFGTESDGKKNPTVDAAALRDSGETVFADNCSGCHGEHGEGEHGPPLANSDWLMNHRQLSMHLVLRGNQETPPTVETLVVRGKEYTGGGMPGWHESLTDYQVASVLTYLRGVLNDSTVVSCDDTTDDGHGGYICVTTKRTQTEMDNDYVTPAEVKAVRDSLSLSNPM
ncbi:MAG TPA: cytochrome c [Fibrobacteria bacterium]|nr:cytochrome c [Fibrobacteria bacterium]